MKYISVNKVKRWAEYLISSERSASGAINAFLKKISRENSRLSGIHVFGLDIEILHQARTGELTIAKTTNINKRKQPLSEVSVLQQNKRYASFGRENQTTYFITSDDHIKLDAYVRACDEALLGRDGYQKLAAVEARLTRKYQVAQRRIEITKLINEQIPIRTINLNKKINQLDDDDKYQSNPDGIMVDKQEIGDTINLKLGEDGKEKYETLAKVRNLFKYQLQHLQKNGISVDGVHWPIELYFF
ncbi:hypothetical protein RhiirC2_799331 [Rhizophagus irregularis]|uniref:Uncharacterized protein n=1 Tax=Rhizophagus irregularis TaxID=588596 RepID=A0A2N1M531_9GLOM|nr:hypothetical protein RhiirC2_799331 [Rhizophagus irregularis]